MQSGEIAYTTRRKRFIAGHHLHVRPTSVGRTMSIVSESIVLEQSRRAFCRLMYAIREYSAVSNKASYHLWIG